MYILWFLGDVTTAEVSVGCAEVEQAKTVIQVAEDTLDYLCEKTRLLSEFQLINHQEIYKTQSLTRGSNRFLYVWMGWDEFGYVQICFDRLRYILIGSDCF